MYYIYILYSAVSDVYYVGYTSNYLNRLEQHNTSLHNTFTSKHRPWKLAAVFEAGSTFSILLFIKEQEISRVFNHIRILSTTNSMPWQ
jgi:putative endonuclease